MAAVKQFRSAFNGFNREDVVRYIELLNNQHANAIAQLTSQLQTAQAQAADPALQEKLSAAETRCAQLEAELEDMVRIIFVWYTGRDSNPQPSEPESDALSIEPPVHALQPCYYSNLSRVCKGGK